MTPKSLGRRHSSLWIVGCVLAALPGCSTLRPFDATTAPLVPTRFQAQAGPFRVMSNTPLEADDPALVALARLGPRIEHALELPIEVKEGSISVYILDDDEAWNRFLMIHHPELPSRSAFFLADGAETAIYTAQSDDLLADLRHEATHALFYERVGPMPLWLDEGLAEYFEVASDRFTAEAVQRYRALSDDLRKGWTPSLERLEAIEDIRDFSPRDYREAWAWAVLLVRHPERSKLTAFLERLAADGPAVPYSEHLGSQRPWIDERLLAQIRLFDRSENARLTRLQSAPEPDDASLPSGVFKRLGTRVERIFERLMPSWP